MLLVTVATQNEIQPLEQFLAHADRVELLVTGMGPVVAAANLSRYLTLHGPEVIGVLNIGVAGAYLDAGVAMLDICLAQQEFLGDFGICIQDRVQDFDAGLLKPEPPMLFNNDLSVRIKNILTSYNISFKTVNFVTVNCCTGTKKRAEYLRDKFAAGCENMEGAAVAMVCRNLNIPCVELRCISNMVEERDTGKWRLTEAVEKMCRVAEVALQELAQDDPGHD